MAWCGPTLDLSRQAYGLRGLRDDFRSSTRLAAISLGAATSDRVVIGSQSVYDNMSAFTFAAWVNVTTFTATRVFASKVRTGDGWNFSLAGTSDLLVTATRGTTSTSFQTNNAGIAVGRWIFVAFSLDRNASPVVHIYIGSMFKPIVECAYGSQVDGSGSFQSDAARSLVLGNFDGSPANRAMQGLLSACSLSNRVLTVRDLRRTQAELWARPPGCVGLWAPKGGFGGGATDTSMPDWSVQHSHGSLQNMTTLAFQPGPPIVVIGRDFIVASPAADGVLAGAAAGQGSATGDLKGAGVLAGAAAGAGAATGDLKGAGALAGDAAGVGSATGTLSSPGDLSGDAAGQGSATGDLKGAGALAGAAAGAGAATGALTAAGALSGGAAGQGSATGDLKGAGTLAGAAAGQGSVTGTLLAPPSVVYGDRVVFVGSLTTIQPTNTGGAATSASLTAGTLPSGMSLDTDGTGVGSVGAIYGTPTTVQTRTGIIITLTNSAGSSASPAFQIDVQSPSSSGGGSGGAWEESAFKQSAWTKTIAGRPGQ